MNYIYGAVAILIAFLGWEVRHQYNGKVTAQLELRDYKTAQAQAVADAEKAAADKIAEAERNNAAILTDLQLKLADSDKRGADLAHRLRIALAHPHPGPVPEGPGEPGTPATDGNAGSLGALESSLGDFIGAAERDASRCTALIGEIRPQL
jgi:hypothetical protein